LEIRIKDNGTARTLAFNAIYRAVGVTLPTTTVISKTLYLFCRYNSTDTKWDVLDVKLEDASAPLLTSDINSTVAPFTPSVNTQTGTTYTLVAADNGKIVTCSNASAITVTVPAGLGAGFHCQVVQIGTAQVTFLPSSTTVNHRQSHTKIAGQYGIAVLTSYATNIFALGGDTTV
jgi:hypothetical protein